MSRTARTRNLSATRQQARRFPGVITPSLFRRMFWRTGQLTRTPTWTGASLSNRELQIFLAHPAARLEDRGAMSMFARSRNYGRTFIAMGVLAAFFWALALGASPQLHQRVHPDAKRV